MTDPETRPPTSASSDRSPAPLPDRLDVQRAIVGDEIVYQYANGLTITTEAFMKADTLRILPLGSPQHALMNHLAHFPERVRDKRVFEPFAGSGALGLMALSLGARSVDFLDINPRAAGFHERNASTSGLDIRRIESSLGDIASHVPEARYDMLLANPPFVPTPNGLEGSLTSAGGSDGNHLVGVLLSRIEQLLEPDGEALVYLLQFEKDSGPLVIDLIERSIPQRATALTASQRNPIPFDAFCDAYHKLFPSHSDAIEQWRSRLANLHGTELTLRHYIADIGPEGAAAPGCTISDDFAVKFGEAFLVPSDSVEELAFGRAMENLVPPATA